LTQTQLHALEFIAVLDESVADRGRRNRFQNEATKPRIMIVAIQTQFFRRRRAELRHAPDKPEFTFLTSD
jgi:hypothetical protein